MVVKYENQNARGRQNNIQADIIVLGCTLPGIVTAHKLKQKFGESMNIVVLDLNSSVRLRAVSKMNVSFAQKDDDDEEVMEETRRTSTDLTIYDNVARHYMERYARDFNIPLPDAIIAPLKEPSKFNKLFQRIDGTTVVCPKDYHSFQYLGYVEKFELEQYHNWLDQNMRNLFHANDSPQERKRLLHFDQTSMEEHLSKNLLYQISKDIMRTTVNLVCGAPAANVSVLFYLHQCYRSNSSRNHLDGDNTRFREKLLGYCRKRLSHKLQKSIADITLTAKPIRKIRTYSGERVLLETMVGETNYICDLLAMALRPEQLKSIRFERELLSESDVTAAEEMTPGVAKKFLIQYEDNFWKQGGYSGDILSIKGPIIWAMEHPGTSTTGSIEKYASLIGYLKVEDEDQLRDSKDAVIDQLVQLFGEEAVNPVMYKETNITDVYIPRNGDYVALRKLIGDEDSKYIFWGAFDVFAEGDVAAALEAGHTAYLHMLRILRPQAQTFDDVTVTGHPTILPGGLGETLTGVSVVSVLKVAFIGFSVFAGVQLIRYLRK